MGKQTTLTLKQCLLIRKHFLKGTSFDTIKHRMFKEELTKNNENLIKLVNELKDWLEFLEWDLFNRNSTPENQEPQNINLYHDYLMTPIVNNTVTLKATWTT